MLAVSTNGFLLPQECEQDIMSSREDARRLVEGICEEHGYIPQEVLNEMSPAHRNIIVRSMRNKDKLISSSVTT